MNGEKRVPDGLNILVDEVRGRALVNRIDATYVVQVGVEHTPGILRVDSDDTPTRQFNVPDADADGNRHLDLLLESKRSLRVHAVDDASGAPAIGVSLSIYSRAQGEVRSPLHNFVEHTVRKTTDAQGNCVFRSLPEDGIVTLTETKDERGEFKPLLSLTVTRESPAELAQTVRVNAKRASVWGILPVPEGGGASASTLRVHRARASETGGRSYDERFVDQNARARWSFECEVPSEWLIWLDEYGERVSPIMRVAVDRAESIGPVTIERAATRDVLLRIIHLPASGNLTLFVTDVAGGPMQKETFVFEAADLEHVIHVRGRVHLIVRCNASGPESRIGISETLTIDPQAVSELVVDMHGDRLHKVELRLNGAYPSRGGILSLRALSNTGRMTGFQSVFILNIGVCAMSNALPAGAYMYSLQSTEDAGLIYGIVNVSDAEDEDTVKIDWHGKAIPREMLGIGVELVSLDGFSCANLTPIERQIRWSSFAPEWPPETPMLLMPDKCEYNVLK